VLGCQATGLLFDDSPHYLDHLAPFCALLEWPLIICEPHIQELARRFYPDLTIIDRDISGLGRWIEQHFSYFVSCVTRPFLTVAFGTIAITHIWLPHGNSDKGHTISYFNGLQQEEIVLIYGQQMADRLALIKGLSPKLRTIRIGNFRNLYYKTRPLSARYFNVKFKTSQYTICYAPTWEDAEKNSSFWYVFPSLLSLLPKDINLLVKLHPNTLIHDAPRVERLLGQIHETNVQFLFDFPPVFPMLAKCDAYLGDASSIGYDFLFFNRPLFFCFPPRIGNKGELLQCGLEVNMNDFSTQDWKADQQHLQGRRLAMRNYVFDSLSSEELRKNIYEISSDPSR